MFDYFSSDSNQTLENFIQAAIHFLTSPGLNQVEKSDLEPD